MFAQISSIVLVGFLLVDLGGVFQAVAQTEDNKAIIQRVADEIWNQGNLAAADELFATNFVNHDINSPDIIDLEGYKGWVLKWRAAFPDYHVEVHDLVAEGDKVGARYTVTGTHQEDFFGVSATGNQVTMMMINIYRLADGKVAEVWRSYDLLGVGQQIGYYQPIPDFPVSFVRRTNPQDFVWGEPSEVTGDPGDPEANKALCVGEAEAWNQGDAAGALDFYAPTFVNHDIYPEITDYESFKQWIEQHIDPDDPTQITIEDIFAEGDRVVYYWTIPGSSGINVYRFADGKIVELWWGKDVLPALIGMGLLPPFEPPVAVESQTWGQVKSLFQE